ENLQNAIHLVAPGGNHGISTEGCTPQIIAQFIERGSMRDVKTDCVAKIKPLPLLLGANQKKIVSSSSDNFSSAAISSNYSSSASDMSASSMSSQGATL